MGSKPLSPTKSSQSYYDDGTTLKTRTGTYKINQKISAGGYGAVYNVTSNERKDLALKVELRNPNRNHFKLTMEIQVLEAAKKVEADNRKHFPILYDQMRFKDRMFIVMTLLGESLADIKRKRPDRVFSLNTGLYCAIQCLTGIELLHKLGFVHRDIKPANFVVGRRYESNQNVVHMVDFGIARYCLDDQGKIKTPRGKLKFKGTVRFAPLATHKLQEVGWKDDCESWVYMVVDLIDTRRLPWQELEDREQVQALKEVAMTEPKKLFPEVERKDMAAIVKYLRLQHYVNQIDYNWLRGAVKRVAECERCTLEQPYDWMIPVKKK